MDDIKLSVPGDYTARPQVSNGEASTLLTLPAATLAIIMALPQVQDAIAAAYQRGLADGVEQATGYGMGEAA